MPSLSPEFLWPKQSHADRHFENKRREMCGPSKESNKRICPWLESQGRLVKQTRERGFAGRISKVMPTLSKPKKQYLVVECTKCGRYLLAASNSKTRTCPYCGKRVSLEDARVAAKSEKPEEARAALQQLKQRRPTGRSSLVIR